MELVKENETFKITDVKENGWKFNGNVTKNVDGTINMNYQISTDSNEIGNGYYSKSLEGRVNANYNVSNTNETEFIDYVQICVSEMNRLLK